METFLNNRLYKIGAVPRLLLGLGSIAELIRRPERQGRPSTEPAAHHVDLLACLGELTGEAAARTLRNRMLLSSSGRRILEERPRVSSASLDLPRLAGLPRATFGYHHFAFFDRNGLSPDSRRPVLFMAPGEPAYVIQRYRECHDFLHTLCGLGISVEEELALKVFEFVQTRLPVTLLSALGGPLALSGGRSATFWRLYLPWALSSGQQAKFYLDVPFEQYLERDIGDVRRMLRIRPCGAE